MLQTWLVGVRSAKERCVHARQVIERIPWRVSVADVLASNPPALPCWLFGSALLRRTWWKRSCSTCILLSHHQYPSRASLEALLLSFPCQRVTAKVLAQEYLLKATNRNAYLSKGFNETENALSVLEMSQKNLKDIEHSAVECNKRVGLLASKTRIEIESHRR